VVICADFSQIEFREYVWYAKAKNLQAMLNSGDYIYGILYEQLFNEPFFKPGGRSKRFRREDIPAWKLLLAKTYPMGFIYGRQPRDPLGAKLYQDFHRANPEISAFHSRLFLQVTKARFYQSVFGRMRRFANPKAQKNEIYSAPGQLTAVDILNKNALIPLKYLLPFFEHEGVRARILFPQYDSVVVSVHKARAEELAVAIKRSMETPIPEMAGLVIPAETSIGPNWDHL
jgi:DNA polymerase I-like protein with 3'-5' exonuclease and polymerase domains